jgi:hypothetical protein
MLCQQTLILWLSSSLFLGLVHKKKNQKKKTGPLTTSDAISYHVAELVWKLRIQASHNERASASEQVQDSARASERASARAIQRKRLRAYYSGSLPPDRPIFIRSYRHRRSHPPNLKFRASFFRA